MEPKPKREREGENKETEENLESRISAGPITNIISLDFVKREGFFIVYSTFEKIENKKFRKYFNFFGDGEYDWEECGECVEEVNSILSIRQLSRALKEDNFYFAHFRACLPPYINKKSTEDKGLWVYGEGDLYSTKDISVNEAGEFRELSLKR